MLDLVRIFTGSKGFVKILTKSYIFKRILGQENKSKNSKKFLILLKESLPKSCRGVFPGKILPATDF